MKLGAVALIRQGAQHASHPPPPTTCPSICCLVACKPPYLQNPYQNALLKSDCPSCLEMGVHFGRGFILASISHASVKIERRGTHTAAALGCRRPEAGLDRYVSSLACLKHHGTCQKPLEGISCSRMLPLQIMSSPRAFERINQAQT